jgi:rfaE bifunctional protein nucleotidyltransferase chain/domain
MSPALPDPQTVEDLLARREQLRLSGETVVLTNGCFDLLHPGHIYYLNEAAKLGSELWIALNGDESVRALKGPSRPLIDERERAYALGSLRSVKEVFVFGTPRLTAEIRALKPDVYVKAGDYTIESLDAGERTALQEVGARIQFIPFLEGFSSTSLMEKIRNAH